MKLKGLLRLISFFQLIYPASFKSAFRQVIGSSEKDGQLMINKVFFMCDRDASCTHVVKLDETRKFKVLHGFAEIDSMVGKISLWEKVAGKNIFFLLPTALLGYCRCMIVGFFLVLVSLNLEM